MFREGTACFEKGTSCFESIIYFANLKCDIWRRGGKYTFAKGEEFLFC